MTSAVWSLRNSHTFEHLSTVGRRVKEVSGNVETELHDQPRSGRPVTATAPDVLTRADAIIRADRRTSTRQLTLQLSVIEGPLLFTKKSVSVATNAAKKAFTVSAVGEDGETAAADLAALPAASSGAVATLAEGEARTSSGQAGVADVWEPLLRRLVPPWAPQLLGTGPQLLDTADKFALPGLKADSEQQVAAQLSVETKAMQSQPQDLLRVIRLLSRRPDETSTPATGDSRSSGRRCTPVAATPPLAACPTPAPGDAVVSRMRSLSAIEKGSRLLQAAKHSRLSEIRVLLAAGVDVGTMDGDGLTALHWAARSGQVEMAECLLAAGADVDARDLTNWTPLYWAAKQGQLEVANVLLSAGADLEARDKWQNTPVFLAAMTGHVDVLRLLVASCADPNAREEHQTTPLHWAAYNGHAGAAAALLGLGAEKRARNTSGRTPLDEAREWSDQQLIDMLS